MITSNCCVIDRRSDTASCLSRSSVTLDILTCVCVVMTRTLQARLTVCQQSASIIFNRNYLKNGKRPTRSGRKADVWVVKE